MASHGVSQVEREFKYWKFRALCVSIMLILKIFLLFLYDGEKNNAYEAPGKIMMIAILPSCDAITSGEIFQKFENAKNLIEL